MWIIIILFPIIKLWLSWRLIKYTLHMLLSIYVLDDIFKHMAKLHTLLAYNSFKIIQKEFLTNFICNICYKSTLELYENLSFYGQYGPTYQYFKRFLSPWVALPNKIINHTVTLALLLNSIQSQKWSSTTTLPNKPTNPNVTSLPHHFFNSNYLTK